MNHSNETRSARIRLIIILLALATLALGSKAVYSKSAPAEGRLLDRALTAIARNYVDPSRINPRAMLDGALDQIQRRIPEILVTNRESGQLAVTVGLASKRIKATPMSSLGDLSRTLHEVLAFVVPHYNGDSDTPPEEIEYAAIDGLLDVLDPHSNFMPPKVYNEFRVGTTGKFGGLGIVISIKDGMLTVVAPIEDTPAARAGIRAGDRIMQIDEESTINMSLTDAVNKLRGDVGTKVTIVVERANAPARKVSLTRAVINIESVQHSLLTEGDKRIGYLKIKSFQDNTDDDVKAAIADLHKDGQQLDGLILDMRNNPGGLLNVASDVADEFLRKGIIVSTVGAREQVMDQSLAHAAGTEPEYPIVVLINEGSASASEIVAGALAQNDRALVLGNRSFGKGSVQTLFELGDDCALKLTIAQYKPAGTETIQLVGITPDVELLPSTVAPDAMNIVEDETTREQDLEKHLDNSVSEGPAIKNEQKAAFRVPYLKPKEDEKKLEERSLKEYSKAPDLTGDFAAGLARTLIARAGDPSRKAMIAKVGPVINEARAEQQAAIDAALKAQGIDWASLAASGAPKLTLAYHVFKGKDEVQRVRAGDKIRLELAATNVGTGPYSQLVAIGKSEMPFLSEREFPFGKIAPGETRRFSSPIEIPEGLPTQELTMDVKFQEEHNVVPESFKVMLPVEELAQPAFSFSTRLTETVKGKPMPTGASIPISFDVINSGQGTSDADTTATISNECGESLFIEAGRVKLGAMTPKSHRSAAFRFHLLNLNTPADCAIKLSIADFKHFAFLTKKIGLLPSQGGLKLNQGQVYSPPRIELAAVPSSTKDPAITISGTVSDTDPVRDCFVFVGERKVAYVPNPDNATSMPFKINLPLEPGSNQIAIGSRDREDMMSRKLIVIERTSGVKSKDKKSSLGPTFLP